MKEDSKIEDRRLVTAIRKDDHHAFDQLFHKYASALHAFLVSILWNEEESEEVVQDVFFKIWKNRKQLDPELSFKSYLYTIAVNATKKRYRKKVQEEKFKQEVALELNVSSSSDLSVVEYQDLLNYIDTIIEKLPPARREVFILSRKQGLKNPEIAKKLNISEQTVKNQLVSAQKFLRAEAAKDHNELGFLFLLFFYRL